MKERNDDIASLNEAVSNTDVKKNNNQEKEKNRNNQHKIKKTLNKNNKQINPNNGKDNVKVMALGGMGEVGKNCYVIEYKNQIIVVDFGVKFPGKDNLGIDYILPNYKYLKENSEKILGLFITHGHEDHIGGIPFLLKKTKIKNIYAPQTAFLMIEKKLKEHKLTQDMILINDNLELKLGDFKITSYRQTHSIPDSLGFFIETPVGNIVTTGDFKIDFSPPGQKRADFHKMTRLSEKGVLCLMSDSTNSMTPGFSLSESLVGENLKMLIKEAQGRIMFTTFASNINRVQQIIEGALENNRKVCILGRSLINGLQIGTKTGYINIKPKDLVDPKSLHRFKSEEIVIISTGSQGESLAALSRIANGLNMHITLDESDTIVFASNPIPGNNFPIGRVVDSLSKTGCKVIRNTDVFKTHASGHASIEEQKLLISLWNPKYFMPVHGTYNMLTAHMKTGMQLGISENNHFIMDNGDILYLNNDKPYIKRQVVPGNSLYVSGNNINVSLKDGTMDKLASDGIMLFSVVYDKHRNLISYPQITTRGFIVINESLDLLKRIQSSFLEQYHANKKLTINELQDILTERMTEFIYKETSKVPYVSVKLIKFNPDTVEVKQKDNNNTVPKKVLTNKPNNNTNKPNNNTNKPNNNANKKVIDNNKQG